MNIFSLCFIALAMIPAVCNATPAQDIIRRADEIRSPNQPFRYTVTVREYKEKNRCGGQYTDFRCFDALYEARKWPACGCKIPCALYLSCQR